MHPSDDWLTEVNRRFRTEEIPPRQRPWLAWKLWALETGVSLALGSPPVDHIFEWFKRNTESGSQLVGPAYVGAFYYDAGFWPLVIPVVYGTVALDPVESLKATPVPVIAELQKSPRDTANFVSTFLDCADYGLHGPDVTGAKLFAPPGQELFRAADKALTSCAELLVPGRPNQKALELARDAVEIHLKSYLAGFHGFTIKDIRNLGHDLAACLRECEVADPTSEFTRIRPHLSDFPDIQERYSAPGWSLNRLWSGYRMAQFVGATLVRIVTGTDCRKNIVLG
jgi:hypothetical protein